MTGQVVREGLEVEQDESHLPAPAPREMVELENSLATVVSTYLIALSLYTIYKQVELKKCLVLLVNVEL